MSTAVMEASRRFLSATVRVQCTSNASNRIGAYTTSKVLLSGMPRAPHIQCAQCCCSPASNMPSKKRHKNGHPVDTDCCALHPRTYCIQGSSNSTTLPRSLSAPARTLTHLTTRRTPSQAIPHAQLPQMVGSYLVLSLPTNVYSKTSGPVLTHLNRLNVNPLL